MLLLIYEYMSNGSLDGHIFCSPEKTTLDWKLRSKIILVVASAPPLPPQRVRPTGDPPRPQGQQHHARLQCQRTSRATSA
ncbi:hypothetical protein SLEP1_g39081 [Rubroshorea leprosula]|uniref:Uncharacterized protein n=1 Tax=Rubroshorea leprosula TaxID=152421 RepID=A0AAV5KZS9_9ROSI|nr:hypothetical protein SLEP1_g39081 [Rubroshorea leprosula]